MLYLRARYYNPRINQFTQPDTIVPDPRIPADWNRFAYVRNNPINFTDPSGHISEKPSERKRAELIVEKLSTIYNVHIKKDWGYMNEFIHYPNMYIDPSNTLVNCQWVEGNWRSVQELEWTLEAVKDMAKTLGTSRLFWTAMRWQPVRLYRHPAQYIFGSGAYSLNNVILPNNVFDSTLRDVWAKGQIVHEFAHVWDTRQYKIFQLSTDMASRTKSYKEVCVTEPLGRGGGGYCHFVYDQAGEIESPPTGYATTGIREDWAESFAVYVYPSFKSAGPLLGSERRSYIEQVIKDLKAP